MTFEKWFARADRPQEVYEEADRLKIPYVVIAKWAFDAGYEQARHDQCCLLPETSDISVQIYLCEHCLSLDAFSYFYRKHPDALGPAGGQLCEDCGESAGWPCIATSQEHKRKEDDRSESR